MSHNLISIDNAPTVETCKSVVFKVARHLLAIPVTAVFKVIRSSSIYSSNLGENKLIHLEERTLPLIDLHPLLSAVKPDNDLQDAFDSEGETETFLVLAKSSYGNLVAIVVDEPPVLMDLSLSQIYALPAFQQQNIGSVASHVAIVPYKHHHLSVLLLDLQQASVATGFDRNLTVEAVPTLKAIES